MKRFPEKRVFITGAGSGLGRALALEFAGKSWRVGLAEIDAVRLEEAAAQVNRRGGQALPIPCDVTDKAAVETAAKKVADAWGGVDIVINNAGVSGCGYMEAIPLERWDWIMAVNLKSVIYGCRTFIPMLAAAGRGHIVNVASYLGFLCAPESSCYNVTKAAVVSLSETLRVELGKKGVGVSVVMPSFFQTNLMDQLYAADARQDKMVRALFARSKVSASRVAGAVIRGIEKNRLYILPQWDARLAWRLKRLSPEGFYGLFGWIYNRGLVERFFQLDL